MRFTHLPMVLLATLAFAGPAQAEDDGELDVTMDVMESESSEPNEMTSEIRLPKDAAEEARDNAAFGLDTANEARDRGRAFGESVSNRARELGDDMNRNLGESVSGEAREFGDRARDRAREADRGRP